MNSPIFEGKTEQWYSRVIVGYVVTASAISVGLAAVMAAGVV